MATTKKSSTTRKKPTTKKSPARKSTSRAASTRSTSTRAKSSTARAKSSSTTRSRAKSTPKTRTTRKSTPAVHSFRVSKQQEPFMSLKITVQTLYWLILAGAVLMLGLWVLNIHNKVQGIYDEIDQSQILQAELDAKELKMLRDKQAEEN